MTVVTQAVSVIGQTDRAPGVTVKGRAVLRMTQAAEQLKDGRELLIVPATVRRHDGRWHSRGRSFPSAFEAVVYAFEVLSEVVWSADA